ncbi:hypothetical protein [Moorena producens]|uniref:hypothetical protein n=1 Tax=Moorena producens TaxID=1155739 RepID=UPI001E351D86|nr:hypothetical protein [Moorena producens]
MQSRLSRFGVADATGTLRPLYFTNQIGLLATLRDRIAIVNMVYNFDLLPF